MTQQIQEKLSRINELAEKAAHEIGLVLLDVRLGQQGKNKSLEVSIYRKEPAISFSDCEQMSRSLERLLEIEETEKSNLLGGPYLLEVVSAGIERQLTKAFEFNLFAGSKVRITTKEKIGSLGTEFVGQLLGGDEKSIVISEAFPLANKTAKNKKADTTNTNNEKISLDLTQIYKIYLWPEAKESNKNKEQ